jgi:hypothetical protein
MSEEIQQSPETQIEQPAPQLTISDLMLALQTIQVTAQRGAIRADEMAAVGGLHDRLFAFLKAQGAIQPAPADSTATDAPQGE